MTSEENFTEGAFAASLLWLAIIAIILTITEGHKEKLKNEAIERGYAEYVIKEKQAVWQWKETK